MPYDCVYKCKQLRKIKASHNAIYHVVDYQHSYVIGKQMPTLYMSRIKHVISKEHAISHEIKIHS